MEVSKINTVNTPKHEINKEIQPKTTNNSAETKDGKKITLALAGLAAIAAATAGIVMSVKKGKTIDLTKPGNMIVDIKPLPENIKKSLTKNFDIKMLGID